MSSHAPSFAITPRRPRQKVFLPAEMIGTGGTVRVHLLNLSTTGVLVYGQPMPSPGSVLQLRCGGTSWLGRVVWVREKRFGIVHLVPLSPTVVATLVESGINATG